MLTKEDIDINKAIAICTSNGITITSVQVGKRYSVLVNDNGEEVRYDKTVYSGKINSAINKTWRHYAAKILNTKNGN